MLCAFGSSRCCVHSEVGVVCIRKKVLCAFGSSRCCVHSEVGVVCIRKK